MTTTTIIFLLKLSYNLHKYAQLLQDVDIENISYLFKWMKMYNYNFKWKKT